MINSKKVYVKAYTRLNVGDDLFVFILCNRYPKYEFYIKESAPYTDVFKTIPNINILPDIQNIQFDAIVYIGGSIFIENSANSILRVLDLKKEIVKDNIPTYIIGANFGPYTSQEYFSTVKNKLLPYIKSITFRDKFSYNLFQDMPNVNYAPDVILSIDTNNIKEDVSLKKSNKSTGEIGISVIHHLERENLKNNYNDYINKLYEISQYYINLGYNIRLFSFCEYEKDMIAINDLIAKMTDEQLNHIFITNYTGNIKEVLNKISCLKLFITSRFHAMILGFKFNIPIIPICYSDKSINVLKDLDFPATNIYTFDNLNNINYMEIPNVFYTNAINDAYKQFKDFDKF